MSPDADQRAAPKGLRSLPRNVWAVSLTSFFMDISSEMVLNVLPLFLSNVLGALDLPASLIVGVLWRGVGSWQGFGPWAPFAFGAALSLIAAILMAMWKPDATGADLPAGTTSS